MPTKNDPRGNNWFRFWIKQVKTLIKESWKPTILVSIKMQEGLGDVHLNVSYPGLTAAQATQLMCQATEVIHQVAQKQQSEKRIVIAH